MIGLPLGWAYGHVAEWALHRFVLHGAGKKRGHPLSFHFHEHHRASRLNNFHDDIYDGHPFKWNSGGKELVGLAALAAAHIPLVTVAPWFTAAVVASGVHYYRFHKRTHVDPEWTKQHAPWHYDHHMGPNQDANYGVRSDWVDRLMGSREPYLGTPRAARDEARRAARSAAVAGATTPEVAVKSGAPSKAA